MAPILPLGLAGRDRNRPSLTKENSMPTCDKLMRLTAEVSPGGVHRFDTFTADFCLTDMILDLYTLPDGFDSKATCTLWLVTPDVSSETLIQFYIDKFGRRENLTTGIVCPK